MQAEQQGVVWVGGGMVCGGLVSPRVFQKFAGKGGGDDGQGIKDSVLLEVGLLRSTELLVHGNEELLLVDLVPYLCQCAVPLRETRLVFLACSKYLSLRPEEMIVLQDASCLIPFGLCSRSTTG